jgi:hypothetical protein
MNLPPSIVPFLSLLCIALCLALVVLLLFRARVRIGLAPLYLTIGVFQHMQVMLANTFYMELVPGYMVSPGSIVMFTIAFFAILLVYISDDAGEARKLCYGLLAANLSMAGISYLLGVLAVQDSVQILYDLPASFFTQDFRIMFVGTVALVVDIVLLIILYEKSARLFPKSLFLRVGSTMIVVLAIDSMLFTTGSFFDRPEFKSMLLSSLAGKTIFALFYSTVLAVYFKFWERKTSESITTVRKDEGWRDVFHYLTYRQKYSVLKELNAELRDSQDQLKTALAEVKTLKELLPICSFCKDIRDEKGDWQNIEKYIRAHTDTEFSHGMCPVCAAREYPEIFYPDGITPRTT